MSEKESVKVYLVEHTKVDDGKAQVQKVLEQSEIRVPRTGTDIVNGRWMALFKGWRTLSGDPEKMVRATLEGIAQSSVITTQRNIYYTIRGAHPDWKYNGMELKDDKVYSAFVGPIMENVQLATQRTMQSFGVRASPRGYIMGDGNIYTPSKGKVPLTAMPALSFDLVDEGVRVDSQARKVIHFEKDAGFEGLAGRDNAMMIEAMYSTSQGYLVESANKFLADNQRRGLNVYVVHDADPHGLQMQLMYGMASKANCYMPSSFYPLPRSCILLGLFPRVGKGLGLPPEEVGEESRKIIPNLEKLCEEHPEMLPELEIIDKENEQWEFQALNGLGSDAPAIYLVEALRVKGDEIKYVPDADSVKTAITDNITEDLKDYTDRKIEAFVDDWFQNGGLKDQLVEKIKEQLEPDITAWKEHARSEIEEMARVEPENFREAVKLELVKDPKRYWNSAAGSVIYDMVDKKFEIKADPVVDVKLENATVESAIDISEPEIPKEPLTKDDIVDSIEKRMVSTIQKRKPLVDKMRGVMEKIFGEPDLEW